MPKTEKQQAARRQRQEENRQPDKDRSKHISERGSALPSLSDLKVALLDSGHLPEVFSELDTQTDRGAALIAAALVDDHLKKAMLTRMAHFEGFDQIMFENAGAPLGTFDARIKMARALNTIGPICEEHLSTIRRIRNIFAHRVLPLDFTNAAIARECEKLLPDDPNWKPEFSAPRRRYILTVVYMSQALEKLSQNELYVKIPAGLP